MKKAGQAAPQSDCLGSDAGWPPALCVILGDPPYQHVNLKIKGLSKREATSLHVR